MLRGGTVSRPTHSEKRAIPMPCRTIVAAQPIEAILPCCRACMYVTTGDPGTRLCDGLTAIDAARLYDEDCATQRANDVL